MPSKRKRYRRKSNANAHKVSISSLQARITKWQNQIKQLSILRDDLLQEAEEFEVLRKEISEATKGCYKYRDEIWQLIRDSKNYKFGSRLLNRKIIYIGSEPNNLDLLKPEIKERVSQLHSLNEHCKQVIDEKYSGNSKEVVFSLNRAKVTFNSNSYSWDHSRAIELVKKRIAELQSKVDLDLPVLEHRKEQKNSEEQKTRAVVAAFYGKTRVEGARLKRQLRITENCPYCGGSLTDDCQADHIYPVSKGGLSTVENMVFVCLDCNQKKTSLTLNQFIKKYSFDRRKIEERLSILDKDF